MCQDKGRHSGFGTNPDSRACGLWPADSFGSSSFARLQSIGDGYAEKLGIAFIAVRRPRARALGIYPLSGG